MRLYRSINGGGSFSQVGNSMHVDHHAQWFAPSNPNIIIKGNDGGVYRSDDGGTRWTQLGGLPISQFYALEVDPSNSNNILGGLQDNGTQRTRTGSVDDWELILGGDGFTVNVDPNNPNVIYAESQFGGLARSTNGGASFRSATSGISGRKNWHTPVVIDPASGGSGFDTTLYYGANRLYRSTDSARSWTAISGDLTNGDGGINGVVFGTLTTVAVAPSDRDTLYIGTDDGNVWVSADRGTTYTHISAALPSRWVTRVAVDPAVATTAYVTLSGFKNDESDANVFRTTDTGQTWVRISSNLPNAPVNDIVIDPNAPDTLYVATDVGVFVSENAGAQWNALGQGFPTTLVYDLKYVPSTPPRLFAATYGRSILAIDLDDAPAPPPPGNCVVEESFEGAVDGWSNDPDSTCSTGAFVIGTPSEQSNGGVVTQVGRASTGSRAYFTAINSSAGADDVDGGTCILRSPQWEVREAATLSADYFHGQRDGGDDPGGDFFRLEYSVDGGASWVPWIEAGDQVSNAGWTSASAIVPAGASLQLRLQCSDGPGAGDLIECGLDTVRVCVAP